MARCEDFPCCGHEFGCCPDFDDAGRQLNMRCTCGAVLPINARYSICDGCMRRADIEDGLYPDYDDRDDRDDDEDYDDSMDGDFDSGMASAGHGTDEDYGYYGEDQFLDGSYEE
jgi:hypothetical protein